MWNRRTGSINLGASLLVSFFAVLLLIAMPHRAIGGPCDLTCTEFCEAKHDACNAGATPAAKGELIECLGFAKAIPQYCKAEKEYQWGQCLDSCPDEDELADCRDELRVFVDLCKLEAKAEKLACKSDFELIKLDNEQFCQDELTACLGNCV